VVEETPKKETSEAPAGGKGCRGFFKVLLVALAILFFIFLLVAGAAALAVAATGLVEVPVFSKLIKPPAMTEDFSYKKVSDKALSQKLEKAMSGTEGNVKVTVTLTDDEANTLIAGLTETPDSFLKSILLKFRPGVIKVSGVLTQNDAPFYLEIRLAKSTTVAEFEIENARLGAADSGVSGRRIDRTGHRRNRPALGEAGHCNLSGEGNQGFGRINCD